MSEVIYKGFGLISRNHLTWLTRFVKSMCMTFHIAKFVPMNFDWEKKNVFHYI